MHVDDFEIPAGKLSETAQRVIDRAVEEVRRRHHLVLATPHLLFAALQIEWDLFAHVMRDVDLNPHAVLRAVDQQLQGQPGHAGRDMRVSPTTKLVWKLALHHASRSGRSAVAATDVLLALFEETHGEPSVILRQQGVDPARVVSRLGMHIREVEARNEQLRKRFELPAQLKQVATNLNLLAWLDRISPAYGREHELQQVLEILSHRQRCNSVMLLGEPGVGKTAIAEELARRIEFEPDTVPVRLRDAHIVNLQMNALVAGTMLRGMFEERVQGVIREVQERPNLILFVDEVHTMVGAGAALGAPTDGAQIFKSVLARGEIRMIGATTLTEYRQHIQEDEALARRFRCVHVPEPSIDQTRTILHKLRPRLERTYSVEILDEALETVLEMSPRYMRHLHLPDKAIGWLDTAAVRTEMRRGWQVTGEDVLAVIANASTIPLDMVARDVGDRFTDLEARLQQRVIGQPDAVSAVARRLRVNKGPLKDGFTRPDGVLLFLGPTGVGKTELAKAVAEVVFGDEHKMVRIDMSEYQDGGSVAKLIGSPRGIIGSEQGGILTNQLRNNPSTVVLLDEIEKAHPALLNLFLQAFDEGWLTDGRGRRVYLSDAIVIMTSNIGSEHFRKLSSPLGFRASHVDIDQVKGDIRRAVATRLAPEFRSRIDEVVLFSPLTAGDVRRIACGFLEEIEQTLARASRTIEIDEDVLDALALEGYSIEFGARFLKRVIDDRIRLPLTMRWNDAAHFHVRVEGRAIVIDAITRQLSSVAHAVGREQAVA